ncbi:ABC transporter ATP-binding protein, partial [Rhizobiaceae sp. 2RAB30]
TTVLRMVAGFEEPSGGNIVVGGKDVTRLKPNQRNVGMVFQAYALFPNLTVAQNIGFGLKVAGVPKAEADARVAEMLGIIKLPDFGDRYPYQLSGGQQQRVALARALAPKPKLLLLDEPLSALDEFLRLRMRGELKSLQNELGITFVHVTHTQPEAIALADMVVVMDTGRIDQADTANIIFDKPKTPYVARFMGGQNVLSGTIEKGGAGAVRIRSAAGAIFEAPGAANDATQGMPMSVSIRRDRITLRRQAGDGAGAVNTVAGVVDG